jgi:hypothetical protein
MVIAVWFLSLIGGRPGLEAVVPLFISLKVIFDLLKVPIFMVQVAIASWLYAWVRQ